MTRYKQQLTENKLVHTGVLLIAPLKTHWKTHHSSRGRIMSLSSLLFDRTVSDEDIFPQSFKRTYPIFKTAHNIGQAIFSLSVFWKFHLSSICAYNTNAFICFFSVVCILSEVVSANFYFTKIKTNQPLYIYLLCPILILLVSFVQPLSYRNINKQTSVVGTNTSHIQRHTSIPQPPPKQVSFFQFLSTKIYL